MKNQQTLSAPIVYDQSYCDEIMRRRGWDSSDPDWKCTPIERCKDVSRENREVTFEYVHMGRRATTMEALDEMDRRDLRPALIEELLSFSVKYPYEQLKYPIVCLGTELDDVGYPCVAVLWRDGNFIKKMLQEWNWGLDVWRGKDDRFLAVRKDA
ncbi:hypothetical protein L0Y59_01275 [Candidatus Uhrbacteria bacterium]|nr:hypothetical protein [Candidatus Uhrbacteria bacterium]